MKQTCLLSHLAALVLATGVACSCSDAAPEQDRSEQTRAELATLVEALDGYHALHGEWPETLAVLVRPDDEGHHFLPSGTSATFDPWGSAYLYERDGDEYRLRSLGSDGEPGGGGLAADLGAVRAPGSPPPADQ